MTEQEERDFTDKWTNALTGLCFRHSYGIESKLTDRRLVQQIEECVRKMVQAMKPIPTKPPQPSVNGQEQAKPTGVKR